MYLYGCVSVLEAGSCPVSVQVCVFGSRGDRADAFECV